MNTYKGWDAIPPRLMTKTTLKKEGLRLARGQQHVAYVETRYGKKRNVYKLYDKYDAVPAKPATAKQLEAVEKARLASLEKRTCKGCGYVEELSRNYRNKIRVEGGLCPHCQKEIEIADDRDSAIQWAKEILADPMAVILDTETVDLNSEIIELAIINMQGDVLFNKRFKPILSIAEGASAVHGMTTEILADEPDFAQYDSPLRFLLGNASKVIIYNASFDKSYLRITCDLHEVKPFKFDSVCAMEMYAQWIGDWSNYHGNYKWYPLSGGDHSALGDCLAALECLHEMATSKEKETTES